jgi:hypothetical protein
LNSDDGGKAAAAEAVERRIGVYTMRAHEGLRGFVKGDRMPLQCRTVTVDVDAAISAAEEVGDASAATSAAAAAADVCNDGLPRPTHEVIIKTEQVAKLTADRRPYEVPG